jgi:hypothetical protein
MKIRGWQRPMSLRANRESKLLVTYELGSCDERLASVDEEINLLVVIPAENP